MPAELIPIDLQAVKAFLLRGSGGSVLIDTGTPQTLPALKQQLQDLLPDLSQLRLILITHGHTDHSGGARALREMSGAPIAIHSADEWMASSGQRQRVKPCTWVGWLVESFVGSLSLPAGGRFSADLPLSGKGLDLHPYGVEARVVHTPGHTPGSLSVLLDGGCAMVADLVMPRIPFMRQPGLPIFADDVAQLRASLKLVLAEKPSEIACSHGGPYSVADVAKAFGM